MVEEAEEFAEEDKKIRDKIESRNALENFVYSMKNTISDADKGVADKISDSDKEVRARARASAGVAAQARARTGSAAPPPAHPAPPPPPLRRRADDREGAGRRQRVARRQPGRGEGRLCREAQGGAERVQPDHLQDLPGERRRARRRLRLWRQRRPGRPRRAVRGPRGSGRARRAQQLRLPGGPAHEARGLSRGACSSHMSQNVSNVAHFSPVAGVWCSIGGCRQLGAALAMTRMSP